MRIFSSSNFPKPKRKEILQNKRKKKRVFFRFSAEIYVAIHPYEAAESGDLSFIVGERITVLQRDGDWWVGRIGHRTGNFPRNYVEKVETVKTFSRLR